AVVLAACEVALAAGAEAFAAPFSSPRTNATASSFGPSPRNPKIAKRPKRVGSSALATCSTELFASVFVFGVLAGELMALFSITVVPYGDRRATPATAPVPAARLRSCVRACLSQLMINRSGLYKTRTRQSRSSHWMLVHSGTLQSFT